MRELSEVMPDFLAPVPWKHPSKEVERRFARWLVSKEREGALASPDDAWEEDWWPIFNGKFYPDSKLLAVMRDLGLAKESDGWWIPVHCDVARLYLCLCASRCANEVGADLATDSESFTEPIFYTQKVLTADVARGVLEAYVPRDIGNVDVRRIAEVREALLLARLEYADEIATLVSKFADGVHSETKLLQLRDSLVELGRQRVEDTQRCYRSARLDFRARTLSVSFAPPALAAWLSSTLHAGIVEPVGLGAALLLFGRKALLDHSMAKKQRDTSPWSYVIRASEQLRT